MNEGVGDHFDSRGCISMKTAYEGCVVPDVEPGQEGEGRTISQLLIPRTCILRKCVRVFGIKAYLPSPYKTSTSSALPFEAEDVCSQDSRCWCFIE